MIIIKTNIDKFTNNYYKVLEVLYDNQITVVDETYCPLSQKEIGKILNLNRMTINNFISDLIQDGYVIQNGRKQYLLTDNAKNLVKKMKKM